MCQLDLDIKKEEVLRYLGYKGQSFDSHIDNLIDECILEIKSLVNLKYILKSSSINLNEESIVLSELNLNINSDDIRNHLKHSKKCFVIAATIGAAVDKKILYYEKINMTKAVILDACATTAIEVFCDFIENEIKNKVEKENMNITWRYSPGYGDFSIDIQGKLLNAINATKTIGINASTHNILTPRKSVTAVIGTIPKNIKLTKHTCSVCSKAHNCKFKKVGEVCGN